MNQEMPTYRVVMHVTADSHPSHWLADTVREHGLEDELESCSLIECFEIPDLPTRY